MKLTKSVLVIAMGLGMAGAAYAADPYQNAAQTELKRQTSEAGLINKAAAKICKGGVSDTEIKKASTKASQNNAKANAKVGKTCGPEADLATNCPGLFGMMQNYPLSEDVDLSTAINAQIADTCVAPM